MQETETKEIYFAGVSGCFYPFTIYPINASLPNMGAVYIFISAVAIPGQYKPLYIGETDALASPILNYENGYVWQERWGIVSVSILRTMQMLDFK